MPECPPLIGSPDRISIDQSQMHRTPKSALGIIQRANAFSNVNLGQG